MGKQAQKTNQTRQDFLMTFFDEHDHYQEKEVNGYWLIFTLANEGSKPLVMIYSKDSYFRYKTFQEGRL